jgi:hypothetical protein
MERCMSRRTSGLIAPVCTDLIYSHGYVSVKRRNGYVRGWAMASRGHAAVAYGRDAGVD